jgi:peptidoglycan-N-acetylglucosamine deacetylase
MIFDYLRLWKTDKGLYDGIDASEIALTFDDGPNDRDTLRIVDVLAEYGIKAAFFMVGKYVRQRPEIARAVHAAGHIVGNHSASHSRIQWPDWYSADRLKAELDSCQKAIEDAIGVTPIFFRPPYGRAPKQVETVVAELGLRLILWSVTAKDWESEMTDALIEEQVREELDSRKQGEIILFHDGEGEKGIGANRQPTVDAVEALIDHYSGSGRRFVPLSEFKFRLR